MTDRRPFWVRTVPPGGGISASGWSITPLLRDYPGFMGTLSLYHATLPPGRMPHEIHAHREEEIEVLLSGELDVITPEQTTRIGPGSFFYHPPGQAHTIRSVGEAAATLFLLRWSCPEQALPDAALSSFLFDAARLPPWPSLPHMQRQEVCAGLPLANGGRLEVHAATSPAHAGCKLHTDPYDVMIVLLEGRVVCLGHDTTAPAAIYYPAGVVHGHAATSDLAMRALHLQFYKPPTG